VHWQNWTLEFVFFTGHNHMFSTKIKDSLCGFNNLLKIPVFRRNASETAQERPDTDGLAEQPQAYLLA